MENSEVFIKIIMSIVVGAVLGIETETREIEKRGEEVAEKEERMRIGGVRTYTLISLLGGIAGLFYINNNPTIVYLLFGAVFALILSAYIMNVQMQKAFGVTTEIAIIITFILGFLVTSSLIAVEVVLLILVLLSFFLSQKRGIGIWIHKIQHKEVIDVIKFGVVAIVLLPLLPNQNITLGMINQALALGITDSKLTSLTLLNPFSVWSVVVLISGFNLLGYLLSKWIGENKSLLLTGILSGLFSSTSALIAFGSKTRALSLDDPQINKLAGASLLSNSTSFVLASILIFVGSRVLFIELLPIVLILSLSTLIIGLILIYRTPNTTNVHQLNYEPFSIGPALKFVSLIVIISFVVQILQLLNINKEFLIIFTAFSGFTGIDAPIIAIGGLFTSGVFSLGDALIAFLLLNTMNYVAKITYSSFTANFRFVKLIIMGLAISGVLGLFGLLI